MYYQQGLLVLHTGWGNIVLDVWDAHPTIVKSRSERNSRNFLRFYLWYSSRVYPSFALLSLYKQSILSFLFVIAFSHSVSYDKTARQVLAIFCFTWHAEQQKSTATNVRRASVQDGQGNDSHAAAKYCNRMWSLVCAFNALIFMKSWERNHIHPSVKTGTLRCARQACL